MTVKTFHSAKTPFSAWKRVFCTGISINGLFSLRLFCIWAYQTCHIWLYSTNFEIIFELWYRTVAWPDTVVPIHIEHWCK